MNIKFGIIGAGMIGSDHATRINKSLNGGIVTAVNDINIINSPETRYFSFIILCIFDFK